MMDPREPTTGWLRPVDWMTLPALAPTDQKFVGLYGVANSDGNYVALLADTSAGTYTVNWGDGTTSAGVTKNTAAEHWYDWSDADLGAAKADGYKQALVTVTPDTGNLTKIDLQRKHSRFPSSTIPRSANWLDIAVNGPNMTVLILGGYSTTASYVAMSILKSARVGVHSCTSVSSWFAGCSGLEYVAPFSTVGVSNISSLYRFCYSLRSVPDFDDTSAVTNAIYLCTGCQVLRYPPKFNGGMALAASMAAMFSGCHSIRELPVWTDIHSATALNQYALSCDMLETIPDFPATPLVTTLQSAFENCARLKRAPAFASLALVNTAIEMFQNCYSLVSVPDFPANMTGLTSTNYMFDGCIALRKTPSIPMASVTSTTGMYQYCRSLTGALPTGMTTALSLVDCKLSKAGIEAVFTALGTAAGAQTVTVTGNHGLADSPDDTIATGKGWTVAA